MNQAALITIANELNHDQMRVLMALLAELDYENYIQVAQMDIADALKMQKTNVSRAVKNLIDFGIILEGPKIGRSKTYRLAKLNACTGEVMLEYLCPSLFVADFT